MQRVVPQILQGVEGFDCKAGRSLLLMGATNVPWQLDPAMLRPLLVMAGAYTMFGLALHLSGMRTEILRRRVRSLTLLEAERIGREAA